MSFSVLHITVDLVPMSFKVNMYLCIIVFCMYVCICTFAYIILS